MKHPVELIASSLLEHNILRESPLYSNQDTILVLASRSVLVNTIIQNRFRNRLKLPRFELNELGISIYTECGENMGASYLIRCHLMFSEARIEKWKLQSFVTLASDKTKFSSEKPPLSIILVFSPKYTRSISSFLIEVL